MTQYRTNTNNPHLNALNKFQNEYGDNSDGFPTKELASEYARLKRQWWGSNLVFLGVEAQVDGKYKAFFNVFD